MTKQTIPSRRIILQRIAQLAASGALLSTARWVGAAESFPSHPISVANPFSAGGSFDQLMRALEPSLKKLLGQPIKQEFIPGAHGQLAMTRVATAKPDGYWIAIEAISNFLITNWFDKPKTYSTESFAFLGTVMVEPLAILVRKESPFKSIEDLIKAGKDGKSPTIGVTQPKGFYHFAAAVFRDVAGINARVINYGGGGPSRNALLSGEVECSLTGLFSAAPVLERVRSLVVFAGNNPLSQELPAPTIDQVLGSGRMPNVLHPTALLAPAAMRKEHPDRFEKLVSTVQQAVRSDETRELVKRMRFPEQALECWTPQQCDDYVAAFAGTLKRFAKALD